MAESSITPWRKAVGRRIRDAREKLRLTQQQVADRLGVSKGAVSHWEIGKYQPEGEMLPKLAKLLGLSTDYILTGVDPGPGSTARNARIATLVPHPTPEEVLRIARGKLDPKAVQNRWPSGLPDADDLIAVDVIDAGMHDRIPHGAKVVVKLGQQPEPGEICLTVLLATNEVLLRRCRPGPSGKPSELPYILKADHGDYGERQITRADKPVVLGTLVATHLVGSR